MKMKIKIIIFGILSIIGFTQCDKEKNDLTSKLILGDSIDLSISETIYNYESEISIKFDSVINDSRCPTNVTCIWEGNAAMKYSFSKYNNSISFVLNTNGGPNFKRDTVIFAYKIEFLNLYPYPEDPGEISQSDYFSKILILKE